ncbi:MAG: histidine kinase, partial [Candidatus Riflebacteria bacterium]
MIHRVEELSEKNRETLKLAACVGSWFRQDVFADIATNGDIRQTRAELIQLANEGFFRLGRRDVTFAHDKVREAAYALTSSEEKASMHYRIAITYLSLLHRFRLEDHIFTIVTQLNQGISHIKTDEEKQQLLKLNLMAGKKSLAANAHNAARGYFQIAIGALPAMAWQNDYESSIDLHTNLARAEYLEKDYTAAERTFDLILKNARSAFDKVPVYEMRSAMYVSQNKILEGLELLKNALKVLGVTLPANPGRLDILSEIVRFKFLIGKTSVRDLIDLPLMKDEHSLAVMRLLNASSAPSFLARSDLFPVIVLHMVNLSLRKGNSAFSPFAYATFGIIQSAGLGDIDAGYEFGKLALKLIPRLGTQARPIESRTIFVFQSMLNHWKYHAGEGKPLYERAFRAGLESGDLQYASYCLNNRFFQGLMIRENLDDLCAEFAARRPAIASLQQHNAYQLYQLNEQSALNLRG